MPTSVISNTVTDLVGAAVPNAEVVIELIPSSAFRLSDGSELASRVVVLADGTGAWSATLEETSNITPAGTYYRATERIPRSKGGSKKWYFTVPASNSALYSVLTSPNTAAGFVTPQVVTSGTRPAQPFPGMVIFETDTGKVLYYYGSTLGWLPNWGVAWGEVSRTVLGSDQATSSTSAVDVTGLSTTFTAVQGRLYAVEGLLTATVGATNGTYTITITDGSNTIKATRPLNYQAASWQDDPYILERLDSVTGSITRKIRHMVSSGTVTGTVKATSEIRVMDIGSTAAPVIT